MADKIFPAKYLKRLKELPDFLDGTNSLDSEEIKKKILESEGRLYEIDYAKSEDMELAKAKEHVKELGASYKEGKNIEAAKIQYYIYTLEERGVEI